MSTPALHVRFASEHVGTLHDGADGRLSFRYGEEWLGSDHGFPISVSLPLREGAFEGGAGHAFFANLLPEGLVRERVARRLGISADNDYAFLAAIGGECAGALSVVTDEEPSPGRDDYRPLSEAELEKMARTGSVLSATAGEDGLRLSLAGAQDKLPVRVDGDRFLVPVGTAASTHVLKLESTDFRHLPANEVLSTFFAAALGLPVVVAELRAASRPFSVAKRFDRVLGEDGVVRRLHQEDLCQAQGLLPSRKYEAEGGPSLGQCIDVVRSHSSEPLVDTLTLLRWAILNVLLGNADGHAKNLSLLYPGRGRLVMAPLYDLVCTRAYRRVDRHLAMSIGGISDPGLIGRPQWQALARQVGVGPKLVLDTVDELVTDAPKALDQAIERFRDAHGEHPILQMVPPQVRAQVRRSRTLLARG